MGSRGPNREETGRRLHTIDLVVGQLIRRLIESDVRSAPAIHAEEIILDVEVEGVRYLAVRCEPEAPHEPQAEPGDPPPDPHPSLSPREFEVARMVAKGYANKSIASVLEISSWTVSSHLRRIYTKLGVTSRAAMVARLLDDRWRAEPREVLPHPAMRHPVRDDGDRDLSGRRRSGPRPGGHLPDGDTRPKALARGGVPCR